MPEEHLRDQLWKLYEKLPEELQETIFSVETADAIGDVCQKNKVSEQNVPEVAKYTGRVLMGLLPPNEFEGALVKEVKLKAETAKNVAREITRFIFFPIKEVLFQLYEIEIAPLVGPKGASAEILSEKPTAETEEEKKPKKTDTYREPFK